MWKDTAFAAELGWRDQWHERTNLLCQILAFAAVLSPLLILYGLKFGIIQTLTDELRSNPANLLITDQSSGSFEPEWFEAMARDPLVGFVVPHTRGLATRAEFTRAGGRGRIVEGNLLASAEGDPLLPPGLVPPGPDQAVVSEPVAQALGIAPGERIAAVAERTLEGTRETLFVELEVAGLVPLGRWGSAGALVALPTLVAVERWRDGYAVPERGWSGREDSGAPYSYASFRLYAADLDAVQPLVRQLLAEGIKVGSQAGQIEVTQALDRSLTGIFAILSLVAGVGYVFAFGATLWANAVRKLHDISLLRLQGLDRRAAIGFPLAQALAIALGGGLLSIALFALASSLINLRFGSGLMVEGSVCHLEPYHLIVAVLGGLLVAVLASLGAAARIVRVDPGGGLRRV